MATQHKNILQLVADDLGLFLHCYGEKNIQTPNIDKLASLGTKFTNAFASTASCSGSRSTIYTGLHTHENGQYGLAHGWNHFQTHDNIETLPMIFNALGYQTGIIGKVHVGPRSAYPWEIFEESHTRDVTANSNRAEAFFESAKATNRPFHLTVGFRDPHRDDSRGGFGNENDGVQAGIKVPDYGIDDVDVPFYLSDVPEVRVELVEYYKAISRMDLGVGLMLDTLEKHGLADNTLVLFVSDNGAPFLNSKTTLYDAGVRLPLIVKCPGVTGGVTNPNMVSFLDILPTCLDWAAVDEKKVDAALTPEPKKSPKRLGTSFLSILDSTGVLPEAIWKQHVFGSHTFHEIQNYWPTRFLRTTRFKYHRNIAWRLDFPFGTDLYGSLSWEGIRNADGPVTIGKRSLEQYLFRGPEELFDLENDPEEVCNLASDKRFESVLLECREKVEAWQYLTSDAWLFKDGVSVMTSMGYQKMGMKLRDRFEVDLKDPGNRKGPHWAPPTDQTDGDSNGQFLSG
jgi:Arylsulfatase A and related enzymes